MQSDTWIQVLLRTLPTIIVLVLGFIAAADTKTRQRWGNLLYQIGSIRPDQRDDVQVGRAVKWPFFIVAIALLAWPFNYYRVATRRFEVKSNIYSKPPAQSTIYDQRAVNSATSPAANATTNPPTDTANAPAPASNSTPMRGTNIYGQPR